MESVNCLTIIGSKYCNISSDKYPTSTKDSDEWLKIRTTNIFPTLNMDEKQPQMSKTLDKVNNPLQNCKFFYLTLSRNQSK